MLIIQTGDDLLRFFANSEGFNAVASNSDRGSPFTFTLRRDAVPLPEPSTWAMMALGFAGLGFAGYRRARRTEVANA